MKTFIPAGRLPPFFRWLWVIDSIPPPSSERVYFQITLIGLSFYDLFLLPPDLFSAIVPPNRFPRSSSYVPTRFEDFYSPLRKYVILRLAPFRWFLFGSFLTGGWSPPPKIPISSVLSAPRPHCLQLRHSPSSSVVFFPNV